MTRLFRYFVFSLCLLSCGCFLKASVAQGDNNSLDDAVSNAMEAARKKWMRELSVYCTFKYTEGCADTIEKGWSGDYDTSRTRKLVASGTLVLKQAFACSHFLDIFQRKLSVSARPIFEN